jgi:uroporphyrin-III C-methyltransferase
LVTLKAVRRLGEADVVVYDALVRPEILAYSNPAAELIAAGKRGGQPSMRQEWITDVLIARAQAGARVVRLKGGDPYVFGRGGEEAAALTAAGVAWEVVPGITSAFAAPAAAGIAVTHRAVASSVAIVTGHEEPERPQSRMKWQALATGIDTLVVLMSMGNLAWIVDQLLTYGRPAATPAAVIQWGTTRDQRAVYAPLGGIVAAVAATGLRAPTTFVVGDVVGLCPQRAGA